MANERQRKEASKAESEVNRIISLTDAIIEDLKLTNVQDIKDTDTLEDYLDRLEGIYNQLELQVEDFFDQHQDYLDAHEDVELEYEESLLKQLDRIILLQAAGDKRRNELNPPKKQAQETLSNKVGATLLEEEEEEEQEEEEKEESNIMESRSVTPPTEPKTTNEAQPSRSQPASQTIKTDTLLDNCINLSKDTNMKQAGKEYARSFSISRGLATTTSVKGQLRYITHTIRKLTHRHETQKKLGLNKIIKQAKNTMKKAIDSKDPQQIEVATQQLSDLTKSLHTTVSTLESGTWRKNSNINDNIKSLIRDSVNKAAGTVDRIKRKGMSSEKKSKTTKLPKVLRSLIDKVEHLRASRTESGKSSTASDQAEEQPGKEPPSTYNR